MNRESSQPVGRGQSLNLPSLLVVLWIFRRAKRGEDADRPEIVSTNAKSKVVLDRAKQLAREDRDDERAVTELRVLAGNKRRTLRQAERASRFMGYHHELAQSNLTNRLLKATLIRGSVPSPPTAEDKERIETVASFNRLPRIEQWAQLTRLQPALHALDADVRAGRFGDITSRDHDILKDRARSHETADGEHRRVVTLSSSDPPLDPNEMRRIQQAGHGQSELMKQLKPLVGPACANDDLLLSSQRALDIANAHLLGSTTS
jgi:hypothetical protein